jgi:hypothetical protein
VIEGLEGATAGVGNEFDRAQMERTLANLGSRVFLMRNVHDQSPVVFQTRWLMSYLRGPLTLPQIRALAVRSAPPPTPRVAAPAPMPPTPAPAPVPPPTPMPGAEATRPALPPEISECFLRPRTTIAGAVTYRPFAVVSAKLHFVDAPTQLDAWLTRTLLAPLAEDGRTALWEEAEVRGDLRGELDAQPLYQARFAPLPPGASNANHVAGWRKAALERLYQQEVLTILKCPALKLASAPEETEGDFRARLSLAMREKRDAEAARLKARYAPKLQLLTDQLRRSQERVAREKSQANQQKFSTVISIGATLLGAFLGRSAMRAGTVGRAATAARSASRIGKENADVARANESVEVLQERLTALQAQFEQEAAVLQADMDPSRMELQPAPVRPRKSDLTINRIGVCWVPQM